MKGLKLAVVSLFSLSLLVLAFSTVLFFQKKHEQARRIEIQQELTIQKTENKKLTLGKTGLQKKLSHAEQRAEEMLTVLTRERENRTSAEEELTELKRGYQRLSQEIEILRDSYRDLQDQNYQAVSLETPGLLLTEVELPPIVMKSSPEEPGSVLVVNRDFNFIVADVGFQDGLVKGDLLVIIESGQPIARVQAEKVYDQFAACAILEESKATRIHEGLVVQRA